MKYLIVVICVLLISCGDDMYLFEAKIIEVGSATESETSVRMVTFDNDTIYDNVIGPVIVGMDVKLYYKYFKGRKKWRPTWLSKHDVVVGRIKFYDISNNTHPDNLEY